MFLSLPTDRVLEMGKAAQSKVESEYTAGSHYDQLMKAYRMAIVKARG